MEGKGDRTPTEKQKQIKGPKPKGVVKTLPGPTETIKGVRKKAGKPVEEVFVPVEVEEAETTYDNEGREKPLPSEETGQKGVIIDAEVGEGD